MINKQNFKVNNLIELSRNSWLNNNKQLSNISGKLVAPVFKSNAYGHGLPQMCLLANSTSPPFIALDSYNEAKLARKYTKLPILIMGHIRIQNFKNIPVGNYSFAVSSIDTIVELGKTRHKVNVHIELETGMNRFGVTESKLDRLLDEIKLHNNIKVEGVMSHLADAANATNQEFTIEQTKLFDSMVETVLEKGHKPKWIHLAQSAGLSKVASKYANVARVGIAAFGVNPLEPNDPKFSNYLGLKPIMTVKSRIVATKVIGKGQGFSYGLTFKANQKMRIAIIPFGYHEGLPSKLSNHATLTDQLGNHVKILGRINMNHTFVDVTGTKLKIGDEVIILSADASQPNSLHTLCNTNNIFNYEMLVNLSPTTRRVIVD